MSDGKELEGLVISVASGPKGNKTFSKVAHSKLNKFGGVTTSINVTLINQLVKDGAFTWKGKDGSVFIEGSPKVFAPKVGGAGNSGGEFPSMPKAKLPPRRDVAQDDEGDSIPF